MNCLTAARIIRDNRLLVVHNIKHGLLRIEPPGGKIENGENEERCVIREAREELGIEIRVTRKGRNYWTYSPEGTFRVSFIPAEIVSGEPRVMEQNKIGRYEWCSYGDLKRYQKQGVLVPNLCDALGELKEYLGG